MSIPDQGPAIYRAPRRREVAWLTPGTEYFVSRVLDSSRQKLGKHQLWTVYRDGFGSEVTAEVGFGDLEFRWPLNNHATGSKSRVRDQHRTQERKASPNHHCR
jgi:hypothetical protein